LRRLKRRFDANARWLAVVAPVLAGGLAFATPTALAASVTHVATADTAEWPVEIDLSASYSGTIEQANIAKEQFQSAPGAGLVQGTELSYQRNTMVVPLRIAGGLWHDLELHVVVPLIISNDQHWNYSGVSNANISTVNKPAGICPEGPLASGQTLCANGLPPNAPQGNTLVPVLPETSNRGNFAVGNITIGMAWAPLTEHAGTGTPTWLLGFDYTVPNASPMNPRNVSYVTGSTVPQVGDGLNHFHPYTALSKRRGVFDSYLLAYADFPVASGRAFGNCGAPATYPNNGALRVNCGVAPFTTSVTRIQPEIVAGSRFGTEIVAYQSEAPDTFTKVAFDISAIVEFHSNARTYTQLSDLLQALTQQQDFMRLGGQVGFSYRASKGFLLAIDFALLHDTDHWLTQEALGPPSDPSGTTVNLVTHANQNPNFDFRYDNAGSRFLLQNSIIGTLGLTLLFMF
jgi:hypothetical protein